MINKSLKYILKMLSYCLKCRKNTESKNPKFVKKKNGRIMLLSKCALYDNKKSKFMTKFMKEQEARELISKLSRIKVRIVSDLSMANILF